MRKATRGNNKDDAKDGDGQGAAEAGYLAGPRGEMKMRLQLRPPKQSTKQQATAHSQVGVQVPPLLRLAHAEQPAVALACRCGRRLTRRNRCWLGTAVALAAWAAWAA